MRATSVTAMAGVLCVALGPPSFAADSCGGGCPKLPNNSRAVSTVGVPLAAYPGNTLSATLAKGKAKRILYAEGMLTDAPWGGGPISRAYSLGINVNGIKMQRAGPTTRESTEDCGSVRADPDGFCTAIVHGWLDMDDPANAGLLCVPITVTLVGGDLAAGPAVGSPIDMSLGVRLQKK